MKKSIVLLMFLLLSGSVFASTPDFAITVLFEDDVNNFDDDFGDLLFLEKPYVTENFYHNVVANYNFQQYDTFVWTGLSSVLINDTLGQSAIFVTNSQYQFSKAGVYTITEFSNSSNSANIIIQPADPILINLTSITDSDGISFTFDTSSFILNNEEVVPVDFDIDNDVLPDDYVFRYFVNDDLFSYDYTLLENKNWTMDVSDLSVVTTLKNGESSYLGRIEIMSIGNAPVEIFVTKENDLGYLLGTPAPQTLFRNSNLFINIQAQIPQSLEAGLYNVPITVNGGGTSQEIIFNFTISDNIEPVIESINFSTERVAVENIIKVFATDNNKIMNITLAYDDELIFLSQDANVYSTSIIFNKISSYGLNFCAVDFDNNEKCVLINKTFSKLDVVDNSSTVVNMPSVKIGKYSTADLFKLNQRVDEGISIQLIDVKGKDLNVSPLIRIVGADGSIKQFSSYVNEIIVYDEGQYSIEVRHGVIDDFVGVLRVEVPDYIESVQDVTFRVAFKEYDVPQDFELAWISGRDFVCTVHDSGDLDTSYYDCNMQYDINIKPDDISIPTTVEERLAFKTVADNIRDVMNSDKRKNAIVVSVLILFLILFAIYSWYMVYVYPYARVKRKIRS